MRRMPTNEQVDELQKIIEGGGAGGGGVFYAIVGTTTVAEITQARADNKYVIAVRENPITAIETGYGYLVGSSRFNNGSYYFIEEPCSYNDHQGWTYLWDSGANTGVAKKLIKLFYAKYTHTSQANTLTYESPSLTRLEFTNLLETAQYSDLSNIILRLDVKLTGMSGYDIHAIGRVSRFSTGSGSSFVELIYNIPGTAEYCGEYRLRWEGTGTGALTITKLS